MMQLLFAIKNKKLLEEGRFGEAEDIPDSELDCDVDIPKVDDLGPMPEENSIIHTEDDIE
jgi:hypothetical protein